MKRPIFIVGFVILLLVLGLGATMMALKPMFLLGRFLLPQHPVTIVLILSIGLAILQRKTSKTFHNFAVRRIREKGLPTELPESERKGIRFWVRATLATVTIFVVLLRVLHRW
jgi:hypothetical protein